MLTKHIIVLCKYFYDSINIYIQVYFYIQIYFYSFIFNFKYKSISKFKLEKTFFEAIVPEQKE